MCGICGFAFPSQLGDRWVEAELVRMRDTLHHRGPDDAGIFGDSCVGLAQRRLSIVDVASGHQPMFSDDGRFVIVYNGEVYNHPTLKADLERDGVQYKTRCDTETVLHLFERYGPGFVDRLRGMFSIAIWDRQSRELLLARDRLGVKPLYYHHRADGTLVFGSEIKAILASGMLTARMNLNVLPDLLANHAPSGAETLFAGVQRLPAGHLLRWREGEVSLTRYWDVPEPPATAVTGSDQDLVAEYGERLELAVRLRLMADVPLGAFLSGGIDSAAIVAIMAGMAGERVKTFSVAFAEREANELAYARMVAERFRTDHHEVVLAPGEFWHSLPRLLWHEDEPIAHPSSIALNAVSMLAAEHVKVVLTGEGSDETLAGYNRYRVTVANAHLGRQYQRLPSSLRSAIRGGISSLPPAGGIARRLRRTFLVLGPELEAIYFDNFAVFGRAAQEHLYASGAREQLGGIDPYASLRRAYDAWPNAPMLERLLYMDIKTYLQELLMKQDQMSMAASIESRVPFLDHPLVEFTMGLPTHLKLARFRTKVILRELMRDRLPPAILQRRKMGFPVPLGGWLRGPYTGMLTEFVLGPRVTERALFSEEALARLVAEHRTRAADHSMRLWLLINMEIWQRIFLDGEPVEGVQASVRAAAA